MKIGVNQPHLPIKTYALRIESPPPLRGKEKREEKEEERKKERKGEEKGEGENVSRYLGQEVNEFTRGPRRAKRGARWRPFRRSLNYSKLVSPHLIF